MNHLELGQIDDAVLLFGGPYSNQQALTALMQEAWARHIAPSQMICTGDVVAYGGAAVETVAACRALGFGVVAGNCEQQLASGAADCGCGFARGSACDRLSLAWYGHAMATLSEPDRRWMAGLPDLLSFRHHGHRYAVLHGGITDVARFIWSTSPEADFDTEWQSIEAAIGPVDHVIAGHCGIPFIRQLAKGRWINAGVIGMPPHDGRQQTRFAVLDGGDVQIHRLSYDVEGAARDMAQAGLPDGYRKGLLTGYWPSEDVLPPGLRLPSFASG